MAALELAADHAALEAGARVEADLAGGSGPLVNADKVTVAGRGRIEVGAGVAVPNV